MSEGEPDGDFEDDDLLAEDLEEKEEREECVQDLLELNLESVSLHLDAAELQPKVVSYAASQAVRDALAVLDMTFVERESFSTRSPVTDPEETVGSWFPDEAHIPAPIDAWARGTLRARRRPKLAEQDIPRSTVGAGSKLLATMGAPRAGVRMVRASTSRQTGARMSSMMPRKSFSAARETVPAKQLRRKQKMNTEEMEQERCLRNEKRSSRVDLRRSCRNCRCRKTSTS